MKKILTVIVVFLLPVIVNAQVILSLIFGDKLNSDELLFGIHVNGSLNYLSATATQKPLASLNAGLFFTYRFNDHWHANVEMLAKYTRGSNGLIPYDLGDPTLNAQFADGKIKRKIQYLSLPLSIRYIIIGGLFAELGPQISLRTKSVDIFSVGVDEGELNLEVDTKHEIRTWDFGWLAGAGYLLGKSKLVALGARYNGGFSDVVEIESGHQANQQWGVYCNIPIGRGKMKKKQEKEKAVQ